MLAFKQDIYFRILNADFEVNFVCCRHKQTSDSSLRLFEHSFMSAFILPLKVSSSAFSSVISVLLTRNIFQTKSQSVIANKSLIG